MAPKKTKVIWLHQFGVIGENAEDLHRQIPHEVSADFADSLIQSGRAEEYDAARHKPDPEPDVEAAPSKKK